MDFKVHMDIPCIYILRIYFQVIVREKCRRVKGVRIYFSAFVCYIFSVVK